MSSSKKARKRAARDPNRVVIFDTTLRDGEQSPGASLNHKEKMEIAAALVRLGVDVIEAGFPIASKDDFEAVRAVGRDCGSSVTVAGLARCNPKDIDRAAEALRDCPRPRLHVFLATSKIHMKYKLKKAKSEILRLAAEGVRRARSFCGDVEFSPEDASRTENDFLAAVVEAVIAEGAGTVNIPDTVGYAVPEVFREQIRYLRERVKNIGDAVISVHCHNDLGLAVANSLAAVAEGARQIECTVNGLGERAGNCSLEEVVMAMRTRADFFGLRTGVDTRRIYPTSRLVATLTGIHVQRNKAIVGENAFAHEAGIHQHGVLAERSTYEIMRPEDVGVPASRLVIGKHSGRHGIEARLRAMGYSIAPAELERVTERVKAIADKKKVVYDADIEAVLRDVVDAAPQIFALERFHVTSGNRITPTATVALRRGKEVLQDAACGDGPVNAVYNAITRLTGIRGVLREYHIDSVAGGSEAMGEVSVLVDFGGREIGGRGTSTDVIEASALAYLAAVNRAAAGRPAAPGAQAASRRRKGR